MRDDGDAVDVAAVRVAAAELRGLLGYRDTGVLGRAVSVVAAPVDWAGLRGSGVRARSRGQVAPVEWAGLVVCVAKDRHPLCARCWRCAVCTERRGCVVPWGALAGYHWPELAFISDRWRHVAAWQAVVEKGSA